MTRYRLSLFTFTIVYAWVALVGAVTTSPVTQPLDAAKAQRIAVLIRQLGHENYKQRDAAQNELIEIGTAALPALRAAQQHQDPEIAAKSSLAIEGILARVETRRAELRQSAEQATAGEDYATARQAYLTLLALPETELRDARAAIRLFEARQDWPALADAYEVAAEAMWRIIHMPAEAFIRPAPEPPQGKMGLPEGRVHEGSFVQVQTNLDGEWSNGMGDIENWIPRIQREQNELRLERVELLKKLGVLSLEHLKAPRRAVAAYEAAGRGVPICTEPLETLIPQIWPVIKVQPDEVLSLSQAGAATIRLQPLEGLADAQVAAGDLSGAADTRLRAMLASLIEGKGDWNSHGPSQQAEKFWQIVRRLPSDEPLPPTLWLDVLDPEHAELDCPAQESGPHGLPFSFPGPRLVIRPGQRALTLTVSADMETPGGSGGVRCFTLINGAVHDLGWVMWHSDNHQDAEARSATFDVPEDVGIIRLEIAPFNESDFHARGMKVKATFAP